MKKLFTLALIGFFYSAYAQLPVSQTAEKKRIVLEEYTGKTCGFCPDGHKIASDMKAADPENVFLINIHTGSYASGTPNYRTDFGSDLASQTGLTGYPSGTVNRHIFAGGNTASSRSAWSGNAANLKTEDAYVNVAADATIDLVTREMTIDVEAYYTANSPASSNFIHVAITQDDIRGPQSGGANYFPENIDENGDYIHNHMLRHLVTGQWGEEITTVSMGNLFSDTYTYTLPAMIGDVEVDLSKLHVVVFMTETTHEIINGNDAKPVLTGLTNNLEAEVLSASTPETSCTASFDPEVSIRNWGNTEITSMKIEYSANDLAAQVYDWTGSIQSGITENIVLPTLLYNSQPTNDITIKVMEVNGGADDITTNNEITAQVLEVPEYNTQTMTLEFTTDQYATETSWKLYDHDGSVLQENGTLANATLYTETLNLPNNDCYTFEFLDSYGDGLTGSGPGTVKLDFNGISVLDESGSFSTVSKGFAIVDASGNGNGNPTDNVSSIVDVNLVSEFNVFPNPATNLVNVNIESSVKNLSAEIVDVLGRTISTKEISNNTATFNTSNLNAGIYLVTIKSDVKTIATTSVIVK